MQQVVFATFNRGKVREVGNLLAGLELEVLSPADFGISTLPLETGDTFLENAVIKASAVWEQLRIPVMADDSGLLVHALDGAPGVSSARYAGPDANDKANNLKLLEALSGETNRSAAFFCQAVCILNNTWPVAKLEGLDPNLQVRTDYLGKDCHLLVASGSVSGVIAQAPAGEGGFGYDPIFYLESHKQTFAQIDQAEKNRLSHRGQAFRTLKKAFEAMMQV